MRTRTGGTDHYATLGVTPTATRDEITAAYRARVRNLHPDTAPISPDAQEQFHRVAAAYRVLSGPGREEYDRERRRGGSLPGPAPGPVVAPHSSGGHQFTRRGARWALGGGVGLIVAGLLAAGVVLALQVRDARLRSRGVSVIAQVVRDDGRARLEFSTAGGDVVRTAVPDQKSGSLTVGDTVEIRYDADNPQHVVTAASTVARDITLWIVAVKLFVVGIVLVVLGARRLARADAPA